MSDQINRLLLCIIFALVLFLAISPLLRVRRAPLPPDCATANWIDYGEGNYPAYVDPKDFDNPMDVKVKPWIHEDKEDETQNPK